MKKIFLALSIMAGSASCTKEKMDTSLPVSTEKKLVQVNNLTNTSDKRTNTYDSQGRLTKVQSLTHVWVFEYLSSKLMIIDKDAVTGDLLSTTEHTLDAAGKTISLTMKNGLGAVTYSQNFEYDENGYLIKEKTVYTNGEIQENFYTISGGNVIKQIYKKNGVVGDVTDYTYDLSISSKIYSTMGSSWQIKNLYGKGFANEMKGFKRYDGAGVLVFQKVCSHVLDAQGYLVKLTNFFPISNLTYEYEYVYQ